MASTDKGKPRAKGKGRPQSPTPEEGFALTRRGTETGQFALHWESEGGEDSVASQELPTTFAADVDQENRRPDRLLSRGAWLAYFGGAFVVVLGLILGISYLASGGGGESGAANPSSSASGGPSPAPTYVPEPQPTWNPTPLTGVDLPEARIPVNPDEPAALTMEDRIWNYVGPGWVLAVNRNDFNFDSDVPEADAFQALYLISPEGHTFFLYNLRKDYHIDIEHWDPVERIAWTHRIGTGDGWETVQLLLPPGEATDAWVEEDEAVRRVDSVTYIATLPDGTTLWATASYRGAPARFFERAPGTTAQMYTIFADTESLDPDLRFVEFWIDADGAKAYFRIDTYDPDDSGQVESVWQSLDLATGAVASLDAVPKAPPGDLCHSNSHAMIGGLLVVSCPNDSAGSAWLIDPTGAREASHYSGSLPSLPSTSEQITLDPSEFGDGWSVAVRALP